MSLFKRAMRSSFELFSQLGFDVAIVYLKFESPRNFERIALSHTEYDGINGFVEILRRERKFRLNDLPPFPVRASRPLLLRWLNYWKQYFRVLAQFGAQSKGWRKIVQEPPRAFSVSGRLLTEAETQIIKAHSTRAGVSTNTVLLFELNRSIQAFLDGASLPCSWIIPVMLYQSPEETTEKGNLTSIMEINIEDADTLQSLQTKIRGEIAAEAYRGTWLGAIINSFLPDKVNRAILSSTVAKKMRVGTFTNLGRWGQNSEAGPAGWSLVPPVHPGQPFGVGLIEYGGKLGLALKTDPSLGLSELDGDRILENWIRRFL